MLNHFPEAQTRLLSNRLQVCAVSFPGIKTIHLRGVVFAGSAHEHPQNNGISHFLEHMLFRGNQRLGNSRQLSLKMEEMGGDLNAVTSFDVTEYWLDYHLDFFSKGLRRFCHFLQAPLFEDIELERSIILEELKSDYNEQNQLIDLDAIVSTEIWKKHGLGLPVSGTPASIANLNRSHLQVWYNRLYQPGNMIIGIAGDIDPESVFRYFRDAFSTAGSTQRISYPAATHSSITTALHLTENKDNQYALQWSFPVYPLNSDLRLHYQLIRRVLDDGSSSRLQRLIREEKGLVYDISADMLFFNNGAMLSISAVIGLDRLPELIPVLADLFQTLINEGISEAELNLARSRYRMALDCSRDSAGGILFETMAPLIYPGVTHFEETRKNLTDVTVFDINHTLQRLLQQDGTCFALVGPRAEEQRAMILQWLGQWFRSRQISTGIERADQR